MAYKTRTVKSAPGLSQEKALITLQNHPEFKRGTRIASIYNQGGCWVAKLIEPKTANETCSTCQSQLHNGECPNCAMLNPKMDSQPCPNCKQARINCTCPKKTAAEAFEEIEEDVKESPAELHDKEHSKHEKSESPLDKHDDHEDSEEKKIKELEKKIDLLLDALGISEKGEGPDVKPKGPDADLPAAPPKGGPADGPKKSEPLPPGSGAKLKPGEVPNKPGVTPVGAPSFASVKQATDGGSMPASPSAAGPVGTAAPCPNCGGTAGNCTCSNPAGTPTAPASMPASPSASGPVTAFTASKLDGGRTLTIRQAKAQLENEFNGFRVARLKREGDAIHARMVVEAGPRWDAFKDKAKGVIDRGAYGLMTGEWSPDPNVDSYPPRWADGEDSPYAILNPNFVCPTCGQKETCTYDKCENQAPAPRDLNDPFA